MDSPRSLKNIGLPPPRRFAYYSFQFFAASINCVNPAMEAGIAGHIWTVAELLGAAD